jgi:hypothetical protein
MEQLMKWELAGESEVPQRCFLHHSYESKKLRPEQGSAESAAVNNGSSNMRGTNMCTRHEAAEWD